ncbi:MAG: DUF2857 domain-containing protein [Candidatus Thiodiazotropha sp.]|jgi:hypothetical protein
MARKEFELTHAVLRYLASCLSEGDWSALRDMGIGPKEAEALRGISLSELTNLERKLAGHVLHVELDRDAFWTVVEQIRRESELHRTRMQLISLDAPSDMMQALFGMGVKEYTFARRVIGAPPGVGRPPEPTEEQARVIWLAWESLGLEPSLAPPKVWLELAKNLDLPLRLIWRVTQRWYDADDDEAANPPWTSTDNTDGRLTGVGR